MPPPQTAIGIVASAVAAVESHPVPAAIDGPTAALFDHLGPEMPLPMKLVFANRWLFGGLIVHQLEQSPTTNAVVRTTTAATIIEGGVKDNVLPARARAVINFRIKPGDTPESVLAHVARVVADKRVKIGLVDPDAGSAPSPTSSTASAAYRTIERTIRQVFPRARSPPRSWWAPPMRVITNRSPIKFIALPRTCSGPTTLGAFTASTSESASKSITTAYGSMCSC